MTVGAHIVHLAVGLNGVFQNGVEHGLQSLMEQSSSEVHEITVAFVKVRESCCPSLNAFGLMLLVCFRVHVSHRVLGH